MRHVIRRHRYKLAFGLPMMLLLASTLSFLRTGEELVLAPEAGTHLAVGEQAVIHVIADSDTPINAIGGTIALPPHVRLLEVTTQQSLIDLWTTKPSIDEAATSISFAGGIVDQGGFVGNGIIFTFTVEALEEGEAPIVFDDAQMLAHDGRGTDVLSDTYELTFAVRGADFPPPDVNGDNKVTITDFGIVSARLFGKYESRYDLNNDGKITIGDLMIVLHNMSLMRAPSAARLASGF